ncbi:MAG: MdtA/MuxA family multidrug efflux RND transporter periplasmic adaptor subunit [Gammaproteobacteria bacterium]
MNTTSTLGPHKKTRRLYVWLAVFALLLLVVIAIVISRILPTKNAQHRGFGQFNGPQPVQASAAVRGNIPITLSALGTVTPLATVTVLTQINGQLMKLGFTEGKMVKKGDFLAQIDPRPYQVALEQAQGQLARDQGLLHQAQSDLARYRMLAAEDSISAQQVTDQTYLVEQYQGTVKSDQAQIDLARLDLSYCHIVAPVSGRVGLRQVDVGNYVQTSNSNGIVVITELSPISVIFTLPEDSIPQVMQRIAAGAHLPVTLYDRTNTDELAVGVLTAVDNLVNTTTGTVQLRALFKNSSNTLFPNEFVNALLLVDTLQNVTVVPSAAIQRGAPGTFVYLVNPDDTVSLRTVTLGPADGERVAILKGLSPGDRVVTDGAEQLRDGAKVMLPQAQAKASSPAGTSTTSRPHSAKHKGWGHRHQPSSPPSGGS